MQEYFDVKRQFLHSRCINATSSRSKFSKIIQSKYEPGSLFRPGAMSECPTNSSMVGGGGADVARGISLDAAGNIYISGVGTAVWEPKASLTPLTAYHGSPECAFLAKLDPSGHMLWYTFPIAGLRTYGSDVKLDGNGNIFLSGSAANAPVWDRNAVVVKLNSAGTFQWGTTLGGSSTDNGYKIALDGLGNILLVGESLAAWGESPVRPYTSGQDIFVAMLSGSGTFQWNTFLGGNQDDLGFSIELDKDRNIYIGGRSYGGWGSPVRDYSGQDGAVAVQGIRVDQAADLQQALVAHALFYGTWTGNNA